MVLMFDFDGVIADSLDYFCRTFLEACAGEGCFQVSDRAGFLRLFETNLMVGMRQAGISGDKITAILQRLGRLMASEPPVYPVFPEMPATLNRLAAAHPLYIITSNLSVPVTDYLRRHDVSGIRDVIGSDREPSKVKKIRQVLEKHPGAVGYYTGDTLGDMLEAREAGVHPVAVLWGWHPRELLLRGAPERLLAAPRDLLAFL